MAESRGNPTATGYNSDGSVDRGLMQVNSIHADMVNGDLSALYSPAINIKIAYSLSKSGTDWSAWSTYNNGKYLQWL
jgi:soluble lytic murein transglycosylase-like protein